MSCSHHAQAALKGGRVVDVLADHQQRRGFNIPSQNRLRSFAEPTNLGPSPIDPHSQASSTTRSTTGTSISARSHYAQAGRPRSRNVPRLTDYSDELQEVLRNARLRVLNDMATEVGWMYGDGMDDLRTSNLRENFYAACNSLEMRADFDRQFEFLLAKELTSIRSKLAELAETFTFKYVDCPDPAIETAPTALNQWKSDRIALITDQTNTANFFLHEYDSMGDIVRFFGNSIFEEFHIKFWYTQKVSPVRHFKESYRTTPLPMYALSGVALLCALRREASGQLSNGGRTLRFEGTTFGPFFDAYQEGMNNILQHEDFGPAFRERLLWLHTRGLTTLATSGPGSPRKVAAVAIPAAVRATRTWPGSFPHPHPPSPSPRVDAGPSTSLAGSSSGSLLGPDDDFPYYADSHTFTGYASASSQAVDGSTTTMPVFGYFDKGHAGTSSGN
ncbi:hypothetical protein JVT61DRAFT_9151 [Boletus reticuloceps]|uniref:DUF6532 domain-containing protein n=1 Tax=Boletus reticuloceps TaxID=495285 RepID=A0A8I3A618_9AGAM|nr:hypothetical protein JVT61DRAFT_9151 [Boletus reticuloceps]